MNALRVSGRAREANDTDIPIIEAWLPLAKQDVSQELVAIKASLDMINAKIDKSSAEVKGELIRWVVSVGLLQMALIAGLVLRLVH